MENKLIKDVLGNGILPNVPLKLKMNNAIEEWATIILEEHREELKQKLDKDFINLILYNEYRSI